jgi:hypothetical protein
MLTVLLCLLLLPGVLYAFAVYACAAIIAVRVRP